MAQTETGLSERQIGALLTTMEVMQGEIHHILECIEGNGKPGMKQELEECKHRVALLEDGQAEWTARDERNAAARRSIIVPLLVRALEYALGGGAFVVLGHLFGLLK